MTSPESVPYERSAAFLSELSAIADVLHAARQSTRPDSRALREVVRMCAVHAREHHMPPETLVRALKELVREVALHDGNDAHRVIYTDRLIAWAIEAYYELAER